MTNKTGRLRCWAWAWAPALGYMAIIFVLSAQPRLPQPEGVLAWDKLQHYLAYMVMGLLIYRAVRLRPVLPMSVFWQSLILGALYAASDEYHQSFTPGRVMSILDWVADITGLLAALLIVSTIRHHRSNGGR